MKQIKFYWVMFCAAFFLYSCEKESLVPSEEESKITKQETFSSFINSGLDFNSYMSGVVANEAKFKTVNKFHSGVSYEEAVFNEYCDELLYENFELGRQGNGTAAEFSGPLNSATNNSKFPLGSIVDGITLSSGQTDLVIFGYDYDQITTKIITANYVDDFLLIDFTGEEVTSVSMDIFSFPSDVYSEQYYPLPQDFSQIVTVSVTFEDGTVSKESTASVTGAFYNIIGTKVISEIKISSTNENAFIGVDNIAFGECEIPDADGDGCLDDDDANDNSNVEITVNIFACDSGVENRMTSDCGITMADEFDSLENGTYKNKGEFMRIVAELTDKWLSNELISSEEKDALVSCAAQKS